MVQELSLRDVFTDCQGGMHSHGRLIKSLSKVYQTTPLEDFWEQFLHHLKYSLIIFKREPAVERTIEFVSKFATSLCLDSKEQKEKKEEQDSDEEEEEEMHPFLLKLFSFLLKHNNANDKAVRFRCCQLVNKLLVSLGDDAQIDDELYDKIYECMLQRMRDKFPIVRMQAVLALARLQDPQNKECPVISAYLFLLGCDPIPDVRRAVLSCIAATTKTLPAILERTRDTKDLVRKLAYQIIAEKIHVRALTIAQRVSLLKQGLNDRCEAVKEACTVRLIQAWLRNFQGNILELLKCLDVENALDISNQMLVSLFIKSPVSEITENFDLLGSELRIPIDSLDCENALYWRSLCAFIKSAGVEAEEYLEKLLPTGSVLANYINTVSEHMKAEQNLEAQLRNEFILQQLLELAALIDFSDEVGRRQVGEVMRKLLLSEHISHSLVCPILTVFRLIYTDIDTRVATLVETISDIREPISIVENSKSIEEQRQRDLKIASVRVELNQLREELDTCIQGQEFVRAADIKAKITELDGIKQELMAQSTESASQEVRVEKNDPVTLLKCMTIACQMLEETALKGLTATIQTLMEVMILPGIMNEEPAVRNAALQALGLCCLLNKDTAKAHLLLFMQVAQIDQDAVKVTSLKIIFDLLHTFGLEAFEVEAIDEENSQVGDKENEESPFGDEDNDDILNLSQSHLAPPQADKETTNTASSVLNILVTLLDSQSSEVRTVAAEGLAKLMLSARIVSAKVMSRLLLLWYNPVTEDDAHLRHCLGAFFPIFAFAGRANQHVLEEAFLPTLRTLFNAPATSPLAEVNAGNVAELLAQLTCTRHLVNKDIPDDMDDQTPHDSMVVRLCNEILTDPNSFNVRTLCKVLNSLEVSPGHISLLKDIKVLAQRMLKEVRDKQCSKMLEKFLRVSSDMLKQAMEASSGAAEVGAGDNSSVEEEIVAAQDQLSRMEVDDVENEEEDPEILPDGEGDTTGIQRLHSKRSKARQSTKSTNSKRTKTLADAEASSESDVMENSVFSSPSQTKQNKLPTATDIHVTDSPAHQGSPAIRRSTRKAVQSPAPKPSPVRRSARNVNSPVPKVSPTPGRRATRGRDAKPSLRSTQKKLIDYLSESDEQPSDTDAPMERTTRPKTRGQGRRTPLSDIENEVK